MSAMMILCFVVVDVTGLPSCTVFGTHFGGHFPLGAVRERETIWQGSLMMPCPNWRKWFLDSGKRFFLCRDGWMGRDLFLQSLLSWMKDLMPEETRDLRARLQQLVFDFRHHPCPRHTSTCNHSTPSCTHIPTYSWTPSCTLLPTRISTNIPTRPHTHILCTLTPFLTPLLSLCLS